MKGCPECGQRFMGNEEFCPKDGKTLVELDDTPDNDLVGTTIDGRYTIDKKLGEGGMGVVYLATHAVIGKKCAVKVLRNELSGESEVAERFTQEARAAAAIGNEHIIEINDFGQLPDGAAYFVMEFLDGTDLHAALEEQPTMPNERALHIIYQCCEALETAHNADIVHRDLKPDNIILIDKGGDPDFVKILDFGIAKVARESGRLTRTGVIFGTPQYMSPEQAAGTNIDKRTDVYSLGIILYEMLSGHVPFEADTFMGVLTKHLYEEPIPPRRLVPPVNIPQSLEAVMLKAIAKKPEKRYQSMSDFGADVKALIDGKTPQIVGDQIRDTAYSTLPPPSPSDVIGGAKAAGRSDKAPATAPKWPVIAGVSAGVLVIGIVAAVLLFTRGKDAPAAEPDPLPPPTDTAAAVATPTPPPQTQEAPKAEADAPEPITVKSKPKGAKLYKKNALVGRLPLELTRPGGDQGETTYKLKLDGYKDAKIVLSSHSPDKLVVALEKSASAASEPAKKKSKKASSETKSPPKKTEKKRKKKKKSSGGDIKDPWG